MLYSKRNMLETSINKLLGASLMASRVSAANPGSIGATVLELA